MRSKIRCDRNLVKFWNFECIQTRPKLRSGKENKEAEEEKREEKKKEINPLA